MRLLVCGGRYYSYPERLNQYLDHFALSHDIECVIEGEATGADTMAREWAEERGIPVEKYPANWKKYGRAAGPLRNKQMVKEGKPDYGIAFYDRAKEESRGTRNMVGQLKEAGIPVEEIDG